MKKILFSKDGNWKDEMIYSCSYRFDPKTSPKFIQEDDCVVNAANPDPAMPHGYDYINLFLKETYGVGTRLSMETSFENFGAPNICIATKLDVDADGYVRHGEYYELVLHEKGLTFWKLYLEDGVQKWYRIVSSIFALPANEIHALHMNIELGKNDDVFFRADVNGDNEIYLRIGELSEEFFVGVSACEQINRIYSFTVEDLEA